MKRIVFWQVAMVLVAVGTYVVVLANGGSEQTAAFAAFAATTTTTVAAFAVAVATTTTVAAFAVAVATTTTVAAFAVAVAAFAAFAAVAVATTTTVVAAFAAFAVAAFAAFAAVAVKDFGVPRRWTFTACGIEAGAIFSALLTGSIGWALVIGAIGTLALLAVWRLGPVATPVAATSRADAERRALDRRIAETERTLADLRAQRAVLDTPPAGATPVPHPNGG